MSTDQGAVSHLSAGRGASVGEEDPLVSVVIPTYNRANLLPDAIDSVFAQTYRNWKLIIVDDGSTDDTREVVQRYSCQRLRYIHQSQAGVAAARNRGIRVSEGRYIAFLDSDDVWYPNKLTEQIELIRKYPDTGMVGGGCIKVDEHGHTIGKANIPPVHIPLSDFHVYCAIPGSTSNVLVKRQIFNEVGTFDKGLPATEDRDMWIRIARNYPVRAVPKVTLVSRIHSGVRRSEDWDSVRKGRKEVISRINSFTGRRRAWSWQFYLKGMGASARNRRLRAFWYVLISFILFPRQLSENVHRLQGAAEKILPSFAYVRLRWVYRKLLSYKRQEAG